MNFGHNQNNEENMKDGKLGRACVWSYWLKEPPSINKGIDLEAIYSTYM